MLTYVKKLTKTLIYCTIDWIKQKLPICFKIKAYKVSFK